MIPCLGKESPIIQEIIAPHKSLAITSIQAMLQTHSTHNFCQSLPMEGACLEGEELHDMWSGEKFRGPCEIRIHSTHSFQHSRLAALTTAQA